MFVSKLQGINLLSIRFLYWPDLSLLLFGASEFVWVPERQLLHAWAGTRAKGPFGGMFFVALIAARLTADITMDRRGARGETGHWIVFGVGLGWIIRCMEQMSRSVLSWKAKQVALRIGEWRGLLMDRVDKRY